EHNLKNVSLELPRNQLIVFTGLSGSGKSSLAFDTIYAEGQRRYVESLSAYARQFLGQMEKPDVDFIEGLSPAISIDQKTASRNPRSTVGTITEIHDYLRLLYARAGIPHCPKCGKIVARQTPQQIVDRILELAEGTRFQVMAPVVRGRKGEFESLLKELSREGFSRARIDGDVRDLAEDIRLDRYYQHSIEVIVDRLVRKEGIERRLTDSLETALRLADGVALIDVEGEAGLTFSQHFACDDCGLSFEELQPRNFSFNSPYGACTTCNGIGTRFQVDWRLAIPNPDRSINGGAIIPWAGRHRATYYSRLLEGIAEQHGMDLDLPVATMPDEHRALVLEGTGDEPITVTYTNRFGKQRRYQTTYEGLVPWLVRRHENSDSESAREFYEQYMRLVPCEACGGARLNEVALSVEIGGRSIHDVSSLSLRKASEFLDAVDLDDRQAKIAAAVLKEVQARLRFLLDVGLDYLTLSRGAATLAGGEAQRIRLGTQIGSGLVGVLYILDEPSVGLHQRDNRRLIETLIRLRDLGNTVVVVEHDEETIRVADYIVDIGPGAGEHGGRIVAEGGLAAIMAEESSITGEYLAGRRSIPLPLQRRQPDGRSIIV
ncbi:MAG: excinuclease ABC subunit UvrA, partial [Acidimicrobiia bacterium]|nr:excinuclease ABC subunit UvrA [Acidimicrobiia bacterium]